MGRRAGGDGMSRRRVQGWCADACGIKMSLGALESSERRITDGLEGAHEEAVASVAEAPTKHLDETTWRESGSLSWLWAGVGEKATAFLIRDSRRAEVAKELIGEEPSGITISDRYGGYSVIALEQRQVCSAHLIRDLSLRHISEPTRLRRSSYGGFCLQKKTSY